MRIIGHIEHPILKITVFKMDNRLSVKLEDGMYEQTYKFRMDDRIQHMADIRQIVDDEFIRTAEKFMGNMHDLKLDAMKRGLPPEPEEAFEKII